jgi:hypothetical protein
MDVPRRPKARLYHLDNIPDKILCTHARKRYRRRCTKQIDLKMLAIYEWLKNPELYRKFHKPILKRQEMTMVKRKIDGQEKTITPLQNFDLSVGRRLDALKYQFSLLTKCTGPQFETTAERLDFVELTITELYDIAIKALRNPTKRQAVKSEFAAKLSAC